LKRREIYLGRLERKKDTERDTETSRENRERETIENDTELSKDKPTDVKRRKGGMQFSSERVIIFGFNLFR
jgi:hypothetical protein